MEMLKSIFGNDDDSSSNSTASSFSENSRKRHRRQRRRSSSQEKSPNRSRRYKGAENTSSANADEPREDGDNRLIESDGGSQSEESEACDLHARDEANYLRQNKFVQDKQDFAWRQAHIGKDYPILKDFYNAEKVRDWADMLITQQPQKELRNCTFLSLDARADLSNFVRMQSLKTARPRWKETSNWWGWSNETFKDFMYRHLLPILGTKIQVYSSEQVLIDWARSLPKKWDSFQYDGSDNTPTLFLTWWRANVHDTIADTRYNGDFRAAEEEYIAMARAAFAKAPQSERSKLVIEEFQKLERKYKDTVTLPSGTSVSRPGGMQKAMLGDLQTAMMNSFNNVVAAYTLLTRFAAPGRSIQTTADKANKKGDGKRGREHEQERSGRDRGRSRDKTGQAKMGEWAPEGMEKPRPGYYWAYTVSPFDIAGGMSAENSLKWRQLPIQEDARHRGDSRQPHDKPKKECQVCGVEHHVTKDGNLGECPQAIANHPDRNTEKKTWATSQAGIDWKNAGYDKMPWGKRLDGSDFDMKAYTDRNKNKNKGETERTLLNIIRHNNKANHERDSFFCDVVNLIPRNREGQREEELKGDSHRVKAVLIDTGARDSDFVSAKLANKILKKYSNVSVTQTTVSVESALKNTRPMRCLGSIHLNILIFNELTNMNEIIPLHALIADLKNDDIIIGRPTIKKYDLLHKCNNQILFGRTHLPSPASIDTTRPRLGNQGEYPKFGLEFCMPCTPQQRVNLPSGVRERQDKRASIAALSSGQYKQGYQ